MIDTALSYFSLNPHHAVLAAMFVALAVGTAVRLGLSALAPSPTSSTRKASLRTWWLLGLVFAGAVFAGALGIAIFMALASALSLRELARMLAGGGTEGEARQGKQRLAVGLIYALIPFVFASIYLGAGRGALSIVPFAAVVLITLAHVVEGREETNLRFTGGLLLGAVTLIYGLGHAALLAKELDHSSVQPQAVSWFLFLVLLTEINDIAQALVGRKFGRTKITPHLSPNKSLEGLLGGIAVTVGLSFLLAPVLTHLFGFWPLVAGLVISLAGFLGDLTVSGVKRVTGFKDSGTRLAGMGGVLDRIDSLTLSAPCFYWLVVIPFLNISAA